MFLFLQEPSLYAQIFLFSPLQKWKLLSIVLSFENELRFWRSTLGYFQPAQIPICNDSANKLVDLFEKATVLSVFSVCFYLMTGLSSQENLHKPRDVLLLNNIAYLRLSFRSPCESIPQNDARSCLWLDHCCHETRFFLGKFQSTSPLQSECFTTVTFFFTICWLFHYGFNTFCSCPGGGGPSLWPAISWLGGEWRTKIWSWGVGGSCQA